MIRNISIKGEVVTLTLALKSERSPLKNVLVSKIEEAVSRLPEVSSVQVDVVALSRGNPNIRATKCKVAF